MFSFKYNKDFFFLQKCLFLFPYVLLSIHQICAMWQTLWHNYSNSSQHLYTLYYVTLQNKCSMMIYGHKKTEGSVRILLLRKMELREALEMIFFKFIMEPIFESKISDSIAQILMASYSSNSVSQGRHNYSVTIT